MIAKLKHFGKIVQQIIRLIICEELKGREMFA